MANNNSSHKNILSRLFNHSQRSISPVSSEGSQGHSSKSPGRKLLSKLTTTSPSQSTLLTLSTENPCGGTSCSPIVDSSTVTAPDDYRTPPALAGPHALATSPAVQNLDDLSRPQGPTTTASAGQSFGRTSNSAAMEGNSQSAKTNPESSIKENLKLTGRALQTLITRAAIIVDTNPAKVALGLVKAVIEIKNAVKDNKDAVARQIASTGGQLEEVEEALRGWKPDNKEGNPWMNHFKATLEEELRQLGKVSDGSNFRKFLDHEDEQKRIGDIFVRINEARVRFELALGVRVFKAVYEVDKAVKALFLDRLKPSDIAHHDYILEGEEGRLLRRQVCTPGTRVGILNDIVTWAKNTSSDSPNVYWLFGHAGSGKTTIAYTIARRFEFAGDSKDTVILGGNFFCSRQFESTRLSRYIIRTIVYHLALKCKAFADALNRSGRLDTITQNCRTQLDGLLFGPWEESEAARRADTSTPPHYLIVIDALDEIDGTGGSDFLRDLVNAINKRNEKSVSCLKFFVTSRSDQGLVAHVKSLERKQLYRLQDVKEEEASADVATYLNASLPHFEGRPEMDKLVAQAAGLFIYAATIVKYVEGYASAEHKERLSTLFVPGATSAQNSEETLLDSLYHQILLDARCRFKSRYYLDILHTFLCSAEPTPTSLVAELLLPPESTEIADGVLKSLHALLYTENDKVLSYHKSFPDFIFDHARSKEFWCDKGTHHRRLTNSCFRVMEGLRFNIANIPSSFIFDRDNHALAGEVERNIPPVLSYSCRNWDHHLSATKSTDSDPLHETLSEFLQLRALFWIEAMNLLDSRGRCYPMCQKACEWVIESKGKPSLPEMLSEAGSFALYFSGGGAWSSTPHLYISALATWPRKSDPIQPWKSHFPGIPQFINASMGGTLLMTLNMDTIMNVVAFSSDDSRIVSSDDTSVRVWDAFTGEEKHVLNGHRDLVTSVAFSSNGSRIVSGSRDKSVRVWDALTGKEKHVLNGRTDWVTSVAFSSDGSRIVSGSGDKSVQVWDAFTGEEKHVLNGHTERVTSVAFSSDGSRIVSGSCDKSLRVWDALTGKEKHVLNGHTGPVTSVAFSSDGSCIVSGSGDQSVRVWDALTGKEKHVLNGHTDWVTSVAFSGDGSRIVSGSWDTSVRVWDALTGEEKHVLNGHTYSVTSVAFLSDGSRIVSGSNDKSFRVWYALTGEEKHVLNGHTDPVSSVAFSSDGSCIVSGSDDKSVRVWDALTGKEKHVLNSHTGWVNSVTFSSDGSCIISGSRDKSVRVWDVLTGEEKHVLNGHTDSVNSVAFSSDGSRIVSGSNDKSVRVWDALMGKEKHVLNGHIDLVTSVAFSSDGSRIVSGSWDKSIRVWDALTGKEKHVLNGHTGWVNSVTFSSDGSRIVSGSWDTSVRVWDALTGEQKHVLNGHTYSVTSVAFSSDGSRIVSGSCDNSVRVWDALTGEEKYVLNGHTAWVNSVEFSSDGSRIVSGSGDKSVRVWDAWTVEEKHVLNSHTGWVNSVTFSSDGRRIVSGSWDKSVRVWGKSMQYRVSRYTREEIAKPTHGLEFTGWLLSPCGGGYIMFVPPAERLPDDANILTIPHSFIAYIDFTNSRLGPKWDSCYSP